VLNGKTSLPLFIEKRLTHRLTQAITKGLMSCVEST
jgi:hypothetical protein